MLLKTIQVVIQCFFYVNTLKIIKWGYITLLFLQEIIFIKHNLTTAVMMSAERERSAQTPELSCVSVFRLAQSYIRIYSPSSSATRTKSITDRTSSISRMDCLLNATHNNHSVNLGSTVLCASKSLNTSAVIPWLYSRMRIFFYMSNPYEESFEFEDQVADYHTEVSC